jgi:hypothetical protein
LKPFSWFEVVINEIVLTSANFWTLAERFREQDLFMTFRLKFWLEIWLEKVIFWLGKYLKKIFGAPPKTSKNRWSTSKKRLELEKIRKKIPVFRRG